MSVLFHHPTPLTGQDITTFVQFITTNKIYANCGFTNEGLSKKS